MLPAQQRLSADQPLVVERVLGLEVQAELIVGLERAAQIAQDRESGGRADPVLRVEEDGAARTLGAGPARVINRTSSSSGSGLTDRA
mgnify:CR=1 FL=1